MTVPPFCQPHVIENQSHAGRPLTAGPCCQGIGIARPRFYTKNERGNEPGSITQHAHSAAADRNLQDKGRPAFLGSLFTSIE